ncbi:MAG: protein-glutamine glutaminase family protein [Chitinophagaceae bacterium]
MNIVPALFDYLLSDVGFPRHTMSREQANKLFDYFRQHPLFNWKNANNGCEGRADAVCVLLDEWKIPNHKGWAFGGSYLKKNHVGELKQNWKYHVAPVLPVEEEGQIRFYILDPATADSLQLIGEWAAAITLVPHSYYFIRQSHWYIFPAQNIGTSKWNTRNRQNRKWMIQCLAGINGLTAAGKARLCFHKPLLKNIAASFEKVKRDKPC